MVKAILNIKCAEGVEIDSKESSWKSELATEGWTEHKRLQAGVVAA